MDNSEGESTSDQGSQGRSHVGREAIAQILRSLLSLEEDLDDLQEGLSCLRRQLEDTIRVVQHLVENPGEGIIPGNQRNDWTEAIGARYLSGAHIDTRRLRGNDPASLDIQRRLLAWYDLSQAERDEVLNGTWDVDRNGQLPP